jgi:hypothetical protein
MSKLRFRWCSVSALSACALGPPLPNHSSYSEWLQHGKWVTPNATIGSTTVSATLEQRNQFMNVRPGRSGEWALLSIPGTVRQGMLGPGEQRWCAALMQVAYNAIDQEMAVPGSALKGTAFWQFYYPGQQAPESEGGGRGLFGELPAVPAGERCVQTVVYDGCCSRHTCCRGAACCRVAKRCRLRQGTHYLFLFHSMPTHPGIYPTDAAFQPIQDNAHKVAQLSTQPVAGCTPSPQAVASVPPVPDCVQTWVNGTAGTGDPLPSLLGRQPVSMARTKSCREPGVAATGACL